MLLEYSCAMQRENTYGRRKRRKCEYAIVVAIVFLICLKVASTAPAPYDNLLPQSSGISEYFSDISGCYYNFQRYEEGDRIVTNEPCLNCTCHNRMLMCYLRVCPFTKAIGQDCTIEKKPDQCCPIITCPEVPVKLLTSSTTSLPTPTILSTEIGFHDNYGCSIHDSFYADGAQVPPDPKKPCELCYCIRNRTACVMQECTLHVEGCKPVFQEGVCCPVRYDCDYEKEVMSTPLSYTSGGVIKSTTYTTIVDCQYGNQSYSDGELITTDKPCEHCYCMRGDIVCAVQDCGEPLQGKDCVPTMPPPERCCPSYYDCPNDTVITENANKISTTFNTEYLEEVSFTEKFNNFEKLMVKSTDRNPILSQEQIYEKLGESKQPINISVYESTATKPTSKHPSEDIQLDMNAINTEEHFTTNRVKEVSSSTATLYETTGSSSEKYMTTIMEIHTTNEYGIVDVTPLLPNVENNTNTTTWKEEPLLLTVFEQNPLSTTPTFDDTSTNVIVNEIIKTTLHTDDQSPVTHTINEESVPQTEDITVAYTITSPENIRTETNIIDKATKLFNNSVVSVTNPNTAEDNFTESAAYEMTTNMHNMKPIVNTESISSINSDQILFQYSSPSNEFNQNTMATDVKNSVTMFPNENISQKTDSEFEPQSETGSNSLNTIVDKNTESLIQNDINTSSKTPTQYDIENIETTITYSSFTFPSVISVDVTTESTKSESTSKQSMTTENVENVATVLSSAVVPGEGSCLVDGITYPNTSIIESSNPCHSKCQCLSSIPTCTLIICGSPPTDSTCMPIQAKPESCCPVYVCDGNKQASTIAEHHIIGHNQIASDEFEIHNVVEDEFIPTTQPSYSIVEHVEIPTENSENVNYVFHEKENTVIMNNVTEPSRSVAKPQDMISHMTKNNVNNIKDSISHNTDATENEMILTTKAVNGLDETTEYFIINASSHNNTEKNSTYLEPVTIQHIYNNTTENAMYTQKFSQVESDVTEKYEQLNTAFESVLFQKTSSVMTEIPITELVTKIENTLNTTEFNEETDKQNEKFTVLPTMTTKKNMVEPSEISTAVYVTVTTHESTSEKDNYFGENSVTTVPSMSQISTTENDYSSNTVEIFHTTFVENNDNFSEQNNEDNIFTMAGNDKDKPHTTILPVILNNKFSGNQFTVSALQSESHNTNSIFENVTDVTNSEQPKEDQIALKPSSSIHVTLITPESVNLTEKVSTDTTEIYGAITTNLAMPSDESNSELTIDNVNQITTVDELKPFVEQDSTTVRLSSALSSLDKINEIASNGLKEKIPNDFGSSIQTEYSPELSSPIIDYSHIEGTNIKQTYFTSFSPITTQYVNTKTTMFLSSNSINETFDDPSMTTSAPVTALEYEEQQTIKIPGDNTVQQLQIVTDHHFNSLETNSSTTSEPNYMITTLKTKISNTTIDESSSNSNLPSVESSESTYKPIQQSTWTRKPIDEEITSELNYYPQASMYPSGIENQSSNIEETGMEDYEEDNNAFGPGTCRYAGKVYVSAQQIPREDPCDFCFCFRSDIICLQQSCPPPIYGCRQEPIQGFCCPRYECPVARDITFSNITSTFITTTTTALPKTSRLPFESYRSSNRKIGCVINDYYYNVGDDITIASGPCLECICGSDGRMKCDPKSCSPEPYVQQMLSKSAFQR